MALTTQQFQAWLDSNSPTKCILVEVVCEISGVDTMLYLSNKVYNTGPTDTPANTTYKPLVVPSISFTQELRVDGSASISWGDISITNVEGALDSWMGYVWANKPITIYIGDVGFSRTDFTTIFTGYISDIASSGRGTLNLTIRDVLQQVNAPITNIVVGGTSANKETLRPLVFGEVFNITPVVYDGSNLKYMVHDGPIERIIEVRDNGAPLEINTGYTVNLTEGTFTLLNQPAGIITCSVQGAKSDIDLTTGALVTHSYTARDLTWQKVDVSVLITDTAHGFTTGQLVNVVSSSDNAAVALKTYTITVVNTNQYTISYGSGTTTTGTLRISSYASTVARVITMLIKKYIPFLTEATFDMTNIRSVETSTPVPIGVYVKDSKNIIELCQEIAQSAGFAFTCSLDGYFKLLSISTPTTGTRSITDEYIIANSLTLQQKVPVKGAVKLGYCKNWTTQENLLTGIPETHKILFSDEFLYYTAKDDIVLDQYYQNSSITATPTYITTNTPTNYVQQVATKMLNLWKVPRFIYSMTLPASFLTVKVGDMVTITHNRFNLQSTNAQVISARLDWTGGLVTLGVLV